MNNEVRFTVITMTCPVCGAVTYVEFQAEGDRARHGGQPTDTRKQHAEWHERTGTT